MHFIMQNSKIEVGVDLQIIFLLMVMFKNTCSYFISQYYHITQVLTVLQIVKGVRVAHTVTSGCATGWVTWEMVFDSQQGQSFLPS